MDFGNFNGNGGQSSFTRNFMWQAPNQRLRAAANAKKRDRDRYKIPFHIKRVTAGVSLKMPEGEPLKVEGRVLLNDFTPTGMGLFTAHKFQADDEVVITLETPTKIEVKARVAWCQECFVVGKVLKAQSFTYRAGLQFKFANSEEEQAIKAFCDELLNTHHCVSLRAA
jgi:Tfp pilus assembly protein PilZ